MLTLQQLKRVRACDVKIASSSLVSEPNFDLLATNNRSNGLLINYF